MKKSVEERVNEAIRLGYFPDEEIRQAVDWAKPKQDWDKLMGRGICIVMGLLFGVLLLMIPAGLGWYWAQALVVVLLVLTAMIVVPALLAGVVYLLYMFWTDDPPKGDWWD